MLVNTQRRLLQATVATLSLIPIGTGLSGAAFGIGVFDGGARLGHDGESLGRYLSGLLLAIGLAFLSTLPQIEVQGPRFRLLTAIVFAGGLARLAGLMIEGGLLSKQIMIGLVMELIVTPGLALWREHMELRLERERVAKRDAKT